MIKKKKKKKKITPSVGDKTPSGSRRPRRISHHCGRQQELRCDLSPSHSPHAAPQKHKSVTSSEGPVWVHQDQCRKQVRRQLWQQRSGGQRQAEDVGGGGSSSSLGLWPSLKIISCIIVLFSAKDSARLNDGGVNRSKATLISVMTNMMFAAATRPINTVMQIHFSGSDGSEKPDESTSSHADDRFWNYQTRKKKSEN